MLIAFPAKLDAILISVAFILFGLSKNDIKLFVEISKDFVAYSTLLEFDFFEINDSKACAIASKPEEDLIFFDAEIKNSGIKKIIWD